MTLPDATAVRKLYEVVIAELMSFPASIQRARVIGYLGNCVLKALEVGEIEARLLAVEERLRNRTP